MSEQDVVTIQKMDNNTEILQNEQANLLSQVDEVRISCQTAESQLSAVLKKISDDNKLPSTENTADISKSVQNILQAQKLSIASDDLNRLNELSNKYAQLTEQSTLLQNKCHELTDTISKIHKDLEILKQYIKLDNLLFHNFPLPEENLTRISFHKWVAYHINRLLPQLEEPVSWLHIKAAHPLKTVKASSKVVIVRFNQRGIRDNIYFNKKNLQGSGVSVTEHLLPSNLKLLNQARDAYGFKNAWTNECQIFALIKGSRTLIKSADDLTPKSGNSEQSNVKTHGKKSTPNKIIRKRWSPPIPPNFNYRPSDFPPATTSNIYEPQNHSVIRPPFQPLPMQSQGPPINQDQGSTFVPQPPGFGYAGGRQHGM